MSHIAVNVHKLTKYQRSIFIHHCYYSPSRHCPPASFLQVRQCGQGEPQQALVRLPVHRLRLLPPAARWEDRRGESQGKSIESMPRCVRSLQHVLVCSSQEQRPASSLTGGLSEAAASCAPAMEPISCSLWGG